jgi:hypothetical protein
MPAGNISDDPLAEVEALSSELAGLEGKYLRGEVTRVQYEVSFKQLKDRMAVAESSAYSLARVNESIARRLRARSYGQPDIQQICYHFTYGSKKPLEPEIGSSKLPRYSVEPKIGKVTQVDSGLLKRLADIGILKATLYERLMFCSKCGTPTYVYPRFKCSKCGSIDISIDRMVEHLKCGTLHKESEFHVSKGTRCPSCSKIVDRPDEQRLVAVVCSCKSCGAQFEDPSQSFYCRKCDFDFNLTTGLLTDVFTFTMNDEISFEVRSHLSGPLIAGILEANGFEVSMPGVYVAGTSQAEFSMLAHKGGRAVAIDISLSEGEVDVDPLLQLYVKLMEAKPDMAIFGAIPRLSLKARKVAAKHDILVSEGKTPQDVASGILELALNSPQTKRVEEKIVSSLKQLKDTFEE